MPRLYMITVPGLSVRSDWRPVHDRLLDDFPEVTDVLATTVPETLLIVYEGTANIDAWLDGVSDGILSHRLLAARHPERTTFDKPAGRRSHVVPRDWLHRAVNRAVRGPAAERWDAGASVIRHPQAKGTT
jgi:hypothetical protein